MSKKNVVRLTDAEILLIDFIRTNNIVPAFNYARHSLEREIIELKKFNPESLSIGDLSLYHLCLIKFQNLLEDIIL